MSTCNELGARNLGSNRRLQGEEETMVSRGRETDEEHWSWNRAQTGWGSHLSPQALSIPTGLVSDHLEVITFPHCQPLVSMPWALLAGTPTGRYLAAKPGPRENSCGLLWALRYDLSLCTAAEAEILRALSHSARALICSWRGPLWSQKWLLSLLTN